MILVDIGQSSEDFYDRKSYGHFLLMKYGGIRFTRPRFFYPCMHAAMHMRAPGRGRGHGCVWWGVGPAGVGWNKSKKTFLESFFSLDSKGLLVKKNISLFVSLNP